MRFGDPPARKGGNDEDAMTPKFTAASKLVVLLAVAAVGFGATSANAQTKRQQYDKDGRPYYGANGPNRSYQQGPNTRVYITTRSWLHARTQGLQGDPQLQKCAGPAPSCIAR